MSQTLVLVRLASELALKGPRTRSHFMQRLVRNLRDALNAAGASAKVETEWGRIYVRLDSKAAIPVIGRVFGISSYSVIDAVTEANVEAIANRGVEIFREHVRGKRYAVRAHRAGQHEFKSKDVEIELGARLSEFGAKVDLTAPEAIAYVEIRNDQAYLFSGRELASGGLPLGVEGRALSLISGGYDSAVSSWLMLKRGIALDYLFCNIGGDAYERAVVQVTKALADDWSYGTPPKLWVVDFDEAVRHLKETTRNHYWQVLLKRLMYRAASQIGARIRADAIITGEAVGQVSSQTLPNLRAIEPAATLPVFRPLLGFDKEEIIARARMIGTAALSESVKEYCAISPGKPVTATTEGRLAAEEAKMDLSVLDRAVENAKMLDVRALTAVDLVGPYIFTESIPDGAVVIDCRTESQYKTWHAPNALHREEWELARDFKKLDKAKKYVLYCAHGMQSAHLAEKMQRFGYEAYSFKGGTGRLMKFFAATT
ncbi:MAG TPA: tRNA uracil 4-sulfurtransferase ThiI [Longimicrobiales bacterium]|nr:tRNA uracil 4-sulfurtransferase ThiI [Longimicrobiales bacterium]